MQMVDITLSQFTAAERNHIAINGSQQIVSKAFFISTNYYIVKYLHFMLIKVK